MHIPNINNIDLNLLKVFDAVYREGNVAAAARRMGMSQPAASHALARLRHALGDDLFVRSARGMLPTARAEQVAGPIRQALGYLELGSSLMSLILRHPRTDLASLLIIAARSRWQERF